VLKDVGHLCVLWKPEPTSLSHPVQAPCPQLAEFVVVTTARPITNKLQLETVVGSPPTLDMMAKILRNCPLTAEHFRYSVAIPGTFAVWVLSREGNHSLLIPRGYGRPDGNLAVSRDSENPCLNLVNSLARLVLNRSVPPETVLWCTMSTVHGDFTVYTIGVPVRCDVCGHPVEKDAGFTLSAKQIVNTPHFWRVRFHNNKARWAERGICSFDQYRSDEGVRESEVDLILNFGSDWMVCDACIVHFTVDRERARRFATAWWRNRAMRVPDDWAATPSDVNMG
jgi:hypothetical protein